IPDHCEAADEIHPVVTEEWFVRKLEKGGVNCSAHPVLAVRPERASISRRNEARSLNLSFSVQQLTRHISTVGGNASQHCLVQPDVHLCRVFHEAGRATQLDGQLFAGRKAAVELQELEQIDDGSSPVQ